MNANEALEEMTFGHVGNNIIELKAEDGWSCIEWDDQIYAVNERLNMKFILDVEELGSL